MQLANLLRYLLCRDVVKTVNGFHENPVSAINHIKKIWGNIDLWWNLPDVILARNEFTLKYANSNNVLDILFKVFKDLSNRKNLN